MRVLYHFRLSTFSRRTRLALAHKGVDVELREGREVPENYVAACKLSPQATMPVLDDEGRIVGDSSAITHYLDAAYPERPSIWPRDLDARHRALVIANDVDVAMNALVDLGTRYYALKNDPAWETVKTQRIGRAQNAIDAVAERATTPFLAGGAWSVADMWTYAATLWVDGWPARISVTPVAGQLLSLGFTLPPSLVAWAKQHENRPDIRAIYT